MIFKELTITIQLTKTIEYADLVDEMSKAMNIYLLSSQELRSLHKATNTKKYCFSGLYPVKNTKIYLTGEMYSFKMRFMDMNVAEHFKNSITDNSNPLFIVLGIDEQIKEQRGMIRGLYTVTPAIITVSGNKNWVRNDEELEFVKKRILNNTNRKFNELYGTKNEVYDFIESIEIQNNIPISFNYKVDTNHKTKLLSNKFKITIKEDELSQKLAFLILGSGLLEKNTLSFGFCTIARVEG